MAPLRQTRLRKAAELVEETLKFYRFPDNHWVHFRTKNLMERIIGEIRRRTRMVDAFLDGQSAVRLCAARLRYIAETQWGTRLYLSMEPFFNPTIETAAA